MAGLWIAVSTKYKDGKWGAPSIIGAWQRKPGAYLYLSSILKDVSSEKMEALFRGITKKNQQSHLEYAPNTFLTLGRQELDQKPSAPKSPVKLKKVDDYVIRWLNPSKDMVKKARDSKQYALRKFPKEENYMIRSRAIGGIHEGRTEVELKEVKKWLISLRDM